MKPNMRLLKPNFTLKQTAPKNDTPHEPIQAEPQQGGERERVVSLKPFRIASARKDQLRESQ